MKMAPVVGYGYFLESPIGDEVNIYINISNAVISNSNRFPLDILFQSFTIGYLGPRHLEPSFTFSVRVRDSGRSTVTN